MQQFEMSDLGILSYFIEMEFKIKAQGFLVHHGRYARDILKWFQYAKLQTSCNISGNKHQTNCR